MQRVIKFRVCYTDQQGTKQMIYKDEDLMLSLNGTVYENYGTKEDPTWEPVFDAYEQPFIQQYTGMVDKDGKEIYEGDIIRYKDPELLKIRSINSQIVKTDEVKFISGCFVPDIWRTTVDTCEIVGNVFEKDKLDSSF